MPSQLAEFGVPGTMQTLDLEQNQLTAAYRGLDQRIATFDVGCEGYGMLVRLAKSSQSPSVRRTAKDAKTRLGADADGGLISTGCVSRPVLRAILLTEFGGGKLAAPSVGYLPPDQEYFHAPEN